MLAIYSIIHFIANGISAYSMSAKYGKDSAYAYLFYGICAYVVPMLLGIVCDVVTSKLKIDAGPVRRRFYWGITMLGTVFVLVGMYFGLYALGVGNALVTMGSLLGCMHDDTGKRSGAKGIGIILAAGIPGLWVGNVAADFTSAYRYIQNVWIASAIIMALVGFMYIIYKERSLQFVAVKQDSDAYNGVAETDEVIQDKFSPSYLVVAFGCILISALGAFVATKVIYDWRTNIVASVLVLLAVVVGRAGGSIVASVIKSKKVSILLMLVLGVLGVVAFVFGSYVLVGGDAFALNSNGGADGIASTSSVRIIFGVVAHLLMNVLLSMIAFYLVDKYKKLRGVSLGLMYVGIFVGIFASHMIIS